MATFTGTAANDTANATTGTLIGFTGGTVGELQDGIGDTFFAGAGSDTVRGGDGNDVLVGHTDIFDTQVDNLNGGVGDDTIHAETNDIIQGGPGRDLLFIVNSNPVNINLGAAGIEWITSQFGNDTIDGSTQTVGIEVYSNGGNDTITGSGFNDIIWSGAGNDLVTGGDGNDVILADVGIDNVSGGNGDDSFYVDASDTVDGGAGFDAVYITGGSGMTLNMATQQLEWAADFVGGNDTIDGSGASVALEVYAAGGTDIVKGGSQSDFLWGGTGGDAITGNGGNDTLVGEAGADKLTGGLGLDTLYGNNGSGGDGAADLFVFTDNWGTDFVYDFENGIDKFDVSAVTGVDSFADLTVTNVGPHAHVSFNGNLIVVANGAGQIDVSDFLFVNAADFAVLQSPASTSTQSGMASESIFGRVFEFGLTEAAGPAGEIHAQLGYGPSGSDPRTDPGWNWIDAAFDAQVGSADEYQAVIPGLSAGSYSYTYRFSFDTTTWTYADLDGTTNGFSSSQLGSLTVGL